MSEQDYGIKVSGEETFELYGQEVFISHDVLTNDPFQLVMNSNWYPTKMFASGSTSVSLPSVYSNRVTINHGLGYSPQMFGFWTNDSVNYRSIGGCSYMTFNDNITVVGHTSSTNIVFEVNTTVLGAKAVDIVYYLYIDQGV